MPTDVDAKANWESGSGFLEAAVPLVGNVVGAFL